MDHKTKSLRFPKQIQRHGWKHGCDNPYKCAERWHKIDPCPADCRHKKCPKLCSPDCAKNGQYSPKRRDGGLVEVSVKSKAGKRGIALPETLYGLLMKHKGGAGAGARSRRGPMAGRRLDVHHSDRHAD